MIDMRISVIFINDIIPYSGTTSTMRRRRSDFEDNSYTACNGVFVLMGNASKIPVAGYGTSRMKIDNNVTRLVNSLHVPDLDCDLISTTKHGSMGNGFAFLLEDSKMYLSFPKVSITQDIPEDCDLWITLQPLTSVNWGIPNLVLDGIGTTNNHFDNFENRINFLNRVLHGKA